MNLNCNETVNDMYFGVLSYLQPSLTKTYLTLSNNTFITPIDIFYTFFLTENANLFLTFGNSYTCLLQSFFGSTLYLFQIITSDVSIFALLSITAFILFTIRINFKKLIIF